MADFFYPTVRIIDTSAPKITCGFKGYSGHKGIDIIPKTTAETPKIFAYDNGTVIAIGNVKGTNKETGTLGCGTYVAIRHEDGTITRYQHLKYNSLRVKKGNKVKKGQEIGTYGRPTTGNSTGCHLHFDISLPTKPSCDYIKSTFCGETRFYVDPKPYLCKTSKKAYKVTASVLNVRFGPTTESARKRQILKNTIVYVTETENGFGRINDDEWVSMTYLKEC